MKRFLLIFFILLTVLLVASACSVYFMRDTLAKTILEAAITRLTGFETKIGALRLILQYPQAGLRVGDLEIRNPETFSERIFAKAPEIYLSFDLERLLKREGILIFEMRLHVNEMHVEKNERGISNLSLLKSVVKRRKRKKPSEETIETFSLPEKRKSFYLDILELTLRKVSYHDRSGLVPKRLAVDLKIEKQVFRGIRDAKAIVNVVLAKVLYHSTIGNLGLDTARIDRTLRRTVTRGGSLLLKAGGDVREKAGLVAKRAVVGTGDFVTEASGEVAEKTEGALRATLNETTGILTKASGAAKSEISGLFGKLKSALRESEETPSDPAAER